MSLIDELLKEKEGLILKRNNINSQIDAINLLISMRGGEINPSNKIKKGVLNFSDISNSDERRTLFPVESSNLFPTNGRKDKQIIWLFNNAVNQGIKLSALQDLYNHYRGLDIEGKEIRISNVARRLLREGKLSLVKYNSNNKLSFWALPSWIDVDGDFFDDHKPNEELLPIEIETIENA